MELTNGNIAKLYKAVYGDYPTDAEVATYLATSTDMDSVASKMEATSGWTTASYDTNELYVNAVYANVLGRTAAEIAADTGVDYWVARLEDTDEEHFPHNSPIFS